MKKFPSFSEFDAKVKEMARVSLRVFDIDEVDAYLNGDEAQGVIKNRYEEYKRDFDEGNIGEHVTLAGLASSPAYCLSLMF